MHGVAATWDRGGVIWGEGRSDGLLWCGEAMRLRDAAGQRDSVPSSYTRVTTPA